jgi:hypothetical protein
VDDKDAEIAELKRRLTDLEKPRAEKAKPLSRNKAQHFLIFALSAIAILVVFGLIHSAGGRGDLNAVAVNSTPPTQPSNVASAPSTPDTNTASAPTDTPASAWKYHTESDNMGRTKTFACTTSTNEVTQSFPYHDSSAELCLRRSSKDGLDAYIQLDGNGQILCGIDSCAIPIKFDGGAIQHFPGVGAADNSSDVIFINSTSRFISTLRRSKRTVIELRLYQNGDQDVVFDTAGLKWP